VLFCCSFTYVTAQIYATGIIASRFLGMPFEVAVFVGLIGILLCSMLGGMRAVTWTQVAQYIVLIVAYLIPVVIMSTQVTGIPIPQLTYGSVLQQIQGLEQQMLETGLATAESLKPHLAPFTTYNPLNFFGLILCLMVGTASLPHILMRYFTTPSVKAARISCGWSLFFIFLLYFTAPAYAAFAKLEVYTNVIGVGMDQLPQWIYQYGAHRTGEGVRGRRDHARSHQGRPAPACRKRRRDPAAAGSGHQHRRHRHRHARDRRHALCDRGPGGGRRTGGGALDGGRAVARHRQRA
jgi:cation/acetate symporter